MLELVQRELKAHFRPEFLNRVDEVLVFHRLGREHMRAIVGIQLARLNRLLAERRITVEASEEALDLLAREGYDPDLRRAPAQARDPAPGAGPARAHGPGRRDRRRRRRPPERHGRRARVRTPRASRPDRILSAAASLAVHDRPVRAPGVTSGSNTIRAERCEPNLVFKRDEPTASTVRNALAHSNQRLASLNWATRGVPIHCGSASGLLHCVDDHALSGLTSKTNAEGPLTMMLPTYAPAHCAKAEW